MPPASARDPLPTAPIMTAKGLADDHDLRIHPAILACWLVSHNGLNPFIAGFCHH